MFYCEKVAAFLFYIIFFPQHLVSRKKSTLPVDLDIGMGVKLIWLQLSELKCVHQS